MGEALTGTKPVVATFLGSEPGDVVDGVRPGVPVFRFPSEGARTLGRLVAYGEWLARPAGELPDAEALGLDVDAVRSRVEAELDAHPEGRVLEREEASALLAAAGLSACPTLVVPDVEAAAAAARTIGYPVVLKASGVAGYHRGEVGGVALDLHDEAALRAAHARMVAGLGEAMVPALVQRAAPPGADVLLAGHQHPTFGGVVRLGLGGAAASANGELPVRVLPLSAEDAHDLVEAAPVAGLLDGEDTAEGGSGASREALVDLLVGAVGGYVVTNDRWPRPPAMISSLGTPPADTQAIAAMWGGDAGRTGAQAGQIPEGDLSVPWTIEDEQEGFNGAVPVALDDRVYRMVSEETADAANGDLLTSLEAISVSSGQRRWRVTLNNFGTPAVTEEIVYVSVIVGDMPSNAEQAASALVALDAASGRELWRVSTGNPAGGWVTSPVVADGVVFVSDPEGTIYARDAVTGAERWTASVARESAAESGSGAARTFAVGNGMVYTANRDDDLVALDAKRGDVRWRVNLADRLTLDPEMILPIAVDGAVQVTVRGAARSSDREATTTTVTMLDSDTGEDVWRTEFPTLFGYPVVTTDTVFIPLVPDDGATRLVALDLNTAETVWERSDVADTPISLSIAGPALLIATGDDNIVILEARTGADQWRGSVASSYLQPPAVADGVILVGSDNGAITALAAGDGAATPVAP